MPDKPWVAVGRVYDHFGYKSQKSALNAISKGTFPVPTFKLGPIRAVHQEVYDEYWRRHRDEGMAELEKNDYDTHL